MAFLLNGTGTKQFGVLAAPISAISKVNQAKKWSNIQAAQKLTTDTGSEIVYILTAQKTKQKKKKSFETIGPIRA